MLAPLPDRSEPRLAPLTQSMPRSPSAVRIDPCHVAGEEAPPWLAAAFAVAGTLIAMMSAALWQQSTAGPPQPMPAMTQRAAAPAREPAPAERLARPQPTLPPEPAQPTFAAPPREPAVVTANPEPPPAPPVAPAPPVLPIAPAAERNAAATSCLAPLTIAFEHSSVQPNPTDMKRALAVLRHWLSQHGDATIQIEGHTDATGNEDLNVLLSYSRAKAIAARLKRENIPARWIAVRAAGAGEARADAKQLAGDRSAILRIAGVDECDQRTKAKRP